MAGLCLARLLGASLEIRATFIPLFTIFGTLLAAVLALNGALANIDNQNRLQAKNRNDKLVAARATLPLALSELVEICDNRVAFELDRVAARRDRDWTLSEVSQRTIKECIEFCDDGPRDVLVEIALIYQILVSRDGLIYQETPSVRSNKITDLNLETWDKMNRLDSVSDWLTLECVSAELFDFARKGRSFKERRNVFGCVMFKLRHLDLEGFSIEGDPEIRHILDRFEKREGFGFVSPTWVNREHGERD